MVLLGCPSKGTYSAKGKSHRPPPAGAVQAEHLARTGRFALSHLATRRFCDLSVRPVRASPGTHLTLGATSELARIDTLLFGGMWASPSFDETPTN